MIRAHSVRTDGLAPWVGAQPAMTIACAWWPIMPDMNCDVGLGRGQARAVGPGLGEGRELRGVGAAAWARGVADSCGAEPQAAVSAAARARTMPGDN